MCIGPCVETAAVMIRLHIDASVFLLGNAGLECACVKSYSDAPAGWEPSASPSVDGVENEGG